MLEQGCKADVPDARKLTPFAIAAVVRNADMMSWLSKVVTMVPTLATGSAHGRLGPGEEAAALALAKQGPA